MPFIALRRSVRLATASAAALRSSLHRCACSRGMSTMRSAHSDEIPANRLVDSQELLRERLKTIRFFRDPRLLGALGGILGFAGMYLAGGVFLHGSHYITDKLSIDTIHNIQESVGHQAHEIEKSAKHAYSEAEAKVKEAVS